jgi:lipopolysaccharide export system protein LptA
MRFALLFLLAAVALLRGQEVLPTDTVVTSNGPLEMAPEGENTVVTLHDQVTVTGTGFKLTCDALKVVTGKGGGVDHLQNAKLAIATGHVRIERADLVATGGRAELFPSERRIVLTENAAVQTLGEKSLTTSPRITLYGGNRQAVFDPPVRFVTAAIQGADLAAPAPAGPNDAGGAPRSGPPPVAK